MPRPFGGSRKGRGGGTRDSLPQITLQIPDGRPFDPARCGCIRFGKRPGRTPAQQGGKGLFPFQNLPGLFVPSFSREAGSIPRCRCRPGMRPGKVGSCLRKPGRRYRQEPVRLWAHGTDRGVHGRKVLPGAAGVGGLGWANRDRPWGDFLIFRKSPSGVDSPCHENRCQK